MTGLLAILSIILIVVILVQIGKVTELSAKIRGEEEAEADSNNRNANGMMLFLIVFLFGCIASAIYYKNDILWYGPHESASAHGGELDSMFNITLFLTGIVFVITHILLFWFAYKYRQNKNRVGAYISHNNTLELVWTLIPAVVMSFLVIRGLVAWNEVMGDVQDTDDYIEMEATGIQFAWIMRYPGPDGALGEKNFRKITATNQLGQDWSDMKNLDDIVSSAPGEVIKLPVGKKVRVRITSRDVLHNFDLVHFRVKMDAVPGLPTYFVFEPKLTTAEYRANLGALDEKTGEPLYPEWHEPSDPTDPESAPRWKEFNFELACAELCGKGHYSMRRIIEVVPEAEWADWAAGQSSFYFSSIRNSDEDPYKGQLFDVEVQARSQEFNANLEKALTADGEAEKIVNLPYVEFETGSARLTKLSIYEIDNVYNTLVKYPNMTIELAGHTDNTGNDENNLALSERRAKAVYDQLINKGVDANRLVYAGYGEGRPIDTNDTDAGRQNNRRTEMKIITQ